MDVTSIEHEERATLNILADFFPHTTTRFYSTLKFALFLLTLY